MTAELSSINPNTSLRGVVVSLPQQNRPLGCALAMRVMQSDLYRQLDEAERADCDELVQRNLEWFRHTSAPRASGLPVKPIKARPDVEAMALKYGQDKFNEGFQRAVDQRSRHPAYDSLGFDEPDFEPLSDELERLDVAAYSLGEILETTTGVLLVLSRLWLDGKLTADDMAVVLQFRQAIKEARNG